MNADRCGQGLETAHRMLLPAEISCVTIRTVKAWSESFHTAAVFGGVRDTETARLFISLPFRTDGIETAYPGCLKTFDARDLDRFLAALDRELRTVAEECDEIQVQEIALGNGSAAHFPADDLTKMIRLIRESFHVSPRARISLTMTPSGFDFYKLSAVRQLGNAAICFELPGLTEETLRSGGYRCSVKKAEDALNCCFQNGFTDFEVSLTEKKLEPEEAERTLQTLLAVHPKKITLRDDAEPDFRQTVDDRLTAAGWSRKDNHWYREAQSSMPRCAVQIGCGPGAVSVFDGVPVKSTADFDFYCAHSDDFEALVKHAIESNHA